MIMDPSQECIHRPILKHWSLEALWPHNTISPPPQQPAIARVEVSKRKPRGDQTAKMRVGHAATNRPVHVAPAPRNERPWLGMGTYSPGVGNVSCTPHGQLTIPLRFPRCLAMGARFGRSEVVHAYDGRPSTASALVGEENSVQARRRFDRSKCFWTVSRERL
jgi:hypothetical protein